MLVFRKTLRYVYMNDPLQNKFWLNPFLTNVPVLYPLKTLKNQKIEQASSSLTSNHKHSFQITMDGIYCHIILPLIFSIDLINKKSNCGLKSISRLFNCMKLDNLLTWGNYTCNHGNNIIKQWSILAVQVVWFDK